MSTSDVELRLPAQSPYVAVLRMTTAGIAARLDFTLDDIEDLRIAVGEACALLLEHAGADSSITSEFHLGEGTLKLRVSVDGCDEDASVDRGSFGWQVLSALVDNLEEEPGQRSSAIAFSVSSAKA